MSEFSIEALWDVFYSNNNRLVFTNIIKLLVISHITAKLFNY